MDLENELTKYTCLQPMAFLRINSSYYRLYIIDYKIIKLVGTERMFIVKEVWHRMGA